MGKKRRTLREPVPLGRIVQKVLAAQRAGTNSRIPVIWDSWRRSVGAVVGANTRPAAVRGKTLIVHVSNSVWMQELQFLKKDIIKKINSDLKKDFVEEIKFKIGPL